MTQYRVSIVGTGYVGLSTAIGFAIKGYKVTTLTHDPEKATKISKGIPPFHEPDLQQNLKKVVNKKLLKCTLNDVETILSTDITFIATGTPSHSDGSIDLQYIKKSADEIGKALKKKKSYHLIVVKSTVVPGTTEKIVKPTIERCSGKRCGIDFGLCMNPEFLRQGAAIYDTLNPDRIVIGEFDQKSGEILEAFYQDFYKEKTPPIIKTNLPTAELIKYANNAFLATKISFINTIANICQKLQDADVTTIANAIGLDKRINPNFLNAGLGYGGSCFPKDVKALIAFSKSLGYDASMLKATEQVNNAQSQQAIELAKKHLGNLKGRKIAILGLAFKPDTDDIREARSTSIIHKLLSEGANVVAYDPVAISNAKSIFGDRIKFASSAIECLQNADCCIIATEWDEFKTLHPEDFIKNMRRPVLIDGRRIYDPKQFSQKLIFAAIGLGQ
jgi:UDPglucose 6-dehydrogenase